MVRTERSGPWGPRSQVRQAGCRGPRRYKLERETGFEPATSTLARSHSTTELFPPLPTLECTRSATSRATGRQYLHWPADCYAPSIQMDESPARRVQQIAAADVKA